MKFSARVFIFILTLNFSIGYSQSVESSAFSILLKGLLSHSVKEVSVTDITDDSVITFIDAREKREYEVSHIQNAIWIGYDDFDLNRVTTVGKESKIIVYCSVGYRSEKIAEKLIKAGYTAVSNLYGGIFEWKNQNHPVYNSIGETEDVHAYDKIWGVWLIKGEKVYE